MNTLSTLDFQIDLIPINLPVLWMPPSSFNSISKLTWLNVLESQYVDWPIRLQYLYSLTSLATCCFDTLETMMSLPLTKVNITYIVDKSLSISAASNILLESRFEIELKPISSDMNAKSDWSKFVSSENKLVQ